MSTLRTKKTCHSVFKVGEEVNYAEWIKIYEKMAKDIKRKGSPREADKNIDALAQDYLRGIEWGHHL